MEIRQAQQRAWQNKLDKGFNTSNVPLEFGLLVGEVGEAFTAWRKRLPDLDAELADIAIYVLSIAQMTGIDLDDAIERKMAENEQRRYVRDEHGIPVRASD